MPVRTYSDTDTSNGINDIYNDQEDSEAYTPDAPDASPQLEEIGPDEFPDYFSELDGRLFPAISSLTPYPLPVDTYEQEARTNTDLHDMFINKLLVFLFL